MFQSFLPTSVAALDDRRAFLKDKKINLPNAKKVSLDKLQYDTFTLDRERLDIEVDNILFQTILSNIYHDYKKLYVFCSSGGGRVMGTEFHRWSWYKYLAGMTLNVEDPMFAEYPDLITAWFYGNKKTSYLLLLLKIIQKIQYIFNIANENVVFIGSSSGGYASLFLADRLLGSSCIAMNPQIKLEKRKDVKLFEKITGISLAKQDVFKRNDLSHIYLNDQSHFFISCNIACKNDFEDQLPILSEKLGLQLKFPLTRIANFCFFLNKTPVANPHHVYILGTMIPIIEGIIHREFRNDIEFYLATYISDQITNDFMIREKLRLEREKTKKMV